MPRNTPPFKNCPPAYKIHIISWRWRRPETACGRRSGPWSRHLLQGLLPWEVTSLDRQSSSVLQTPGLSQQGLCWRENPS